jgi:predicted nucleic acid-binding protein
MNKPPVKIVCDAGPVIHLDELKCLTLLADFDEVLVPEQVWQEVIRYRPGAFEIPGVDFQKVAVSLSSAVPLQSLARSLPLDHGEQAALTLMESHPEAIFLTDDAAARLAAVTLGYKVHGTIGILIRAIRRGQRTREEVVAILRDLPVKSTLHIRRGLLTDIIVQIENR